jgi:hypothetical protein
MRRIPFLQLFLAVPLSLVVACGDDGGDDSADPDAMPDDPDADTTPDATEAGACGTAAGAISSYPGTYSGSVIGGGADYNVAEGTCTVEVGYYDQAGEDVVIDLSGLTAGTNYAVTVDSADDLGVYVATSCDAAGPASGACLAMTDATLAGETIYFTATGATASVIVDNYDAAATAGDFTLTVDVAECIDSTECSGATPTCVNYDCVECATSFDCGTAAESVCDTATNTCGVGPTACTGDDTRDTTAPGDDGPAGATALTLPTAGVPTVITSNVCGTPATEQDWFTFTTTAVSSYGFNVNWATAGVDIDVVLFDDEGAVVRSAATDSTTGPEQFLAANLPIGTYYVMVYQYAPTTAPAGAYTLTMSIPECTTSFQCGTAAEPICSTAGECVATTANACVGDDVADAAAASDDGPGGSTLLVSGVGVAANVCNSPTSEADWYRFVVASAGSSAQINLTWGAMPPDLDVYVYDSTGALLGLSFWVRPEVVDLSYLAAGTYYVMINKFDPAASTTAVEPYTITATVTPQTGCTMNAQCDDEYSTQFLRSVCTAGACGFLPPGSRADGMPCDSGDDCMSGSCSYIQFDADAGESVCTTTCTTTADCAAITGTACTAGLCRPTCATDLECGANTGSDMLDTGEPWDYGTCTVATGECTF